MEKKTNDGYNDLNRPLDNKHEIDTKIGHAHNECPEFPYFGATYPDARCIDGYLWDLDKCEGDQLYGGGEEPCPFCNSESFITDHHDPMNGNTKPKLRKYIADLKTKYNYKNENAKKG